jgi:hypothetical protein
MRTTEQRTLPQISRNKWIALEAPLAAEQTLNKPLRETFHSKTSVARRGLLVAPRDLQIDVGE